MNLLRGACVLGLALAAATRAAAGGESFPSVEVAPGVHVHVGAHRSVEGPGRDDIANLAFVVGERCVAVIDSGGSVEIGRRLRARIAEVTPLPVCHVINTHVHYDHLLGNAAFRGPGVSFVGHAALAEAVEGNRTFFAERFAPELGSGGGADVVAPDVLVEGRQEIDLGNRRLVLESHPVAHSGQDLTVLDVATQTLFLGDLLFMERVPTLDGSLRGWLAVLAERMGQPAERVVPGHGPASAPWPEAAEAERRYLEAVAAGVRAAIAAGRFMEDAAQEVAVPESAAWLLHEEVHARNVTRAYKELEWE